MKMLNTNRLSPLSLPAALVAGGVAGVLSLCPMARGGGEHTDFPDLSIRTPLPRPGYNGLLPKLFDSAVTVVFDDEGNSTQTDFLLAPDFPPRPIFTEDGLGFTPGSGTTGAPPVPFSSIPSPGVGSAVVLGAAVAGLRRRRRAEAAG